MSMKRIKISAATEAQIAEFLTVMHGVELKPAELRSRNALTLAVRRVIGDADEIVVSDAAPASPPTAATSSNEYGSISEFLAFARRPDLTDEERRRRDETKITIIIDRSDEPGGDQPVPVSVNGRNMFINRGEPSDVRYPYYAALLNAQRLVVEQSKIGDAPNERTVQAYPFQTIRIAA